MRIWKFLFLVVSLLAFLSATTVFADETSTETAATEDAAPVPDAPAEEKAPEKPKTPPGFSEADEKAISESKESFQFQAEVSRLMDIIINSLYKNKEVFLRELISNASDALDKIRFLSLSSPDVLEAQKDFEIRVSFDEEAKTLTIRDTGVGMSKVDLVNNLGTVARSGTSAFAEAVAAGVDQNLIGQFGVGFYSVYLVADKVRVVSKNPYDDQHVWESDAEANFVVAKDPRGNTLGRGTEITIFLKEEAGEYATQTRLEEIIHRHSEFITFPIYLNKKHIDLKYPDDDKKDEAADEDDGEEEEGDDESTEDEAASTDADKKDDIEVKEEEEEPKKDDGKPKPKPEPERIERWEWERINSNMAIWTRDRDEITDDEYRKFFKSICLEPTEAQTWIHFRAEGDVDFQSILFVPTDALNLYDEYKSRKAGVRLYVKRVLIQDDFEDLLPAYLNFIRGVVDSNDLPLNVSRETLQQHRVLKVMAKKLVRKVLEMLRKLATGEEDDEIGAVLKKDGDEVHPYIKFWEQFGKSIKMGIIEDTTNRIRLAKLLRYKSLKSPDKWISLEDYVKDKKDWQKDIYYIAGESKEIIEKSPFLEVAKKKDIDVIYMTEPIDEYSVHHLADFDGHRLQSLTKEGLKFPDEDEEILKKRAKAYKDQFKPLIKYLKDLFKGRISKISVSTRVEKTPAVIVTSQYGNTANMERIMRAQTLQSKETVQGMTASRTFEVNPRHPIILELNSLVKANSKDPAAEEIARLLFDTALQTSGFSQDDPEAFADRVYRTMARSLSLPSLELAAELEFPEEEEEDDEDDEEEISLDSSTKSEL